MKLNLSPQVICRTPLFSIDDKLYDVWDDLKDCIQHSSPEFYQLIKDYSAKQLNNVDPKLKFTIWKYFNRAKYRPTPFGKFASISLVDIKLSNGKAKINIKREPTLHQWTDWSDKDKVLSQNARYYLRHARLFRANTTAYCCGNEIRYIVHSVGRFELNAVDGLPILLDLINYCSEERPKHDLIHFISVVNKSWQINAEDFIAQLINLQLLFTDLHPNIIGRDFFQRMGSQLGNHKKRYIISERQLTADSTLPIQLNNIPELILFLHQNIPDQNSDPLSDFKSAFIKKFEYKEVPLMIAIDPEMGVGYDNLEQAKHGNEIIEQLSGLGEKLKSPSILYLDFHRFLLNGIVQNQTIKIETYTNKNLGDGKKIPNTFSAFASFYGDLIIMGQIGGCTANALLGRFTTVNRQLKQLGLRNCLIENKANSDVLFFDIGYQAEGYIDNVNRRKLLSTYELPLLSWSCSKNVLSTNDILVSVRRNEIVLRSAGLGKRLIPRIASAYNYNHSDLSVFRFLCDVQQQGLATSFNFDLKQYFPGLTEYPRVQYKQFVLSPATWLLPEELCHVKNIMHALPLVKGWLKKKDIDFMFKAGESDQILCFNPLEDDDLIALLQYCQKKANTYIQEAFVTDGSIVSDETGKKYMSELILGIEHIGNIYTPLPISYTAYNQKSEALKMPGSEWLYFEIYCHEQFSNELLITLISPFLKDIKKQIRKWFFVRYNDPKPCIRLRLNTKGDMLTGHLISKFYKILEQHILTGIVSDCIIKPYIRELERYGPESIDRVENFFKADSEYALRVLKQNWDEELRYIHSLELIKNTMAGLNWDFNEQLNFATILTDGFSKEMDIKTEGFRIINKSFEAFVKKEHTFSKSILHKRSELEKEMLKILEKCKGIKISKLLSDLFHMHVNRLFAADQRMHEMLIYSYLKKDLERSKSRLMN